MLHLAARLALCSFVVAALTGQEPPATADPLPAVRAARDAGDAKRAVQLLERAMAAIKARGDRGRLADALELLGSLQRDTGAPAAASQSFDALIELRRQIDGDTGSLDLARALNERGVLAYNAGQMAIAERHCREAALVARRHGDHDSELALSADDNTAGALAQLDRMPEAVAIFERTVEIRERQPGVEVADLATAVSNLAACLQAIGRYDESARRFEQGLRLMKESGHYESMQTVGALTNLGNMLRTLGKFDEAIRNQGEAHRMAQKLLTRPDTYRAIAASNYAGGLYEAGRLAESVPIFESALAELRELHGDNHPEVALVMSSLAICYASLGRGDEAVELERGGLSILRKFYPGDSAHVAMAMLDLARRLLATGHGDEAGPQYEASLAMMRRVHPEPHPQLATCLALYATYLGARGDAEGELAKRHEALEMRRAIFGDTHPQVAESRSAIAHSLFGLGRYDECVAEFELAVRAARHLDDRQLYLYLTNEALVELHWRNNARRAVELLEEAVQQVERLREDSTGLGDRERAEYFSSLMQAGAHANLIDAYMRLDDPLRAMTTAERARGRAFLDLLRRAQVDPLQLLARVSDDESRPELAQEVRQLIAGMQDSRAQQAAATQEFMALAARGDLDRRERIARQREVAARLEAARAAHREGERQRARLLRGQEPIFQPVDAEALTHLLNDDERLVMFALTGRDVALFVLPKAGNYFPAATLGIRGADLNAKIERYAESLRDPTPLDQAALQLGYEIFQALMPAEIWAGLRQLRRIHVLRDGAMESIPLEALVVEAPIEGKPAVFWLDVGPPITYGASGTTLMVSKVRRDAQLTGGLGTRVVAVGDPRFVTAATAGDAAGQRAGGELPPLPHTRNEVQAIERAFKEGLANDIVVTTLLGDRATESAVYAAAADARVLHMATHHLLASADQAEYSGLALTPPATASRLDDGFLRLDDLLERWRGRLRGCELVVLSGCETGRSSAVVEAGFHSMPWGFMFAGVPTVIASLWKVDDRSTAELMGEFYARWRAGADKLDAFTASRRQLRARQPHPYYWAGFVCLGDPR